MRGPIRKCAEHGGSGDKKLMRWEKRVGRELGASPGKVLGYMLRSASTVEGFTMKVKICVIQCPSTEFQKERMGFDRFIFLKDNVDPHLLYLEMR